MIHGGFGITEIGRDKWVMDKDKRKNCNHLFNEI